LHSKEFGVDRVLVTVLVFEDDAWFAFECARNWR
jgi:hypothetical protein